MSSTVSLTQQSLAWLLDPVNPTVRYLALRDLLNRSADDPELRAMRAAAHRQGPIAEILAAMDTSGFWESPGPGYGPKYRSTVWAVTLLAQLGATIGEDPRIATACSYILDHTLTSLGQFSSTNAPSGTIDCLHGNMTWALLELGCRDPRMECAIDWLARSVTGEGIAPASDRVARLRYYSYKSGPDFSCGINNRLSCAWGGTKVLLALGNIPQGLRTPLVDRAIQRGVDFFFSIDPASAAYPSTNSKPSRNWWKFGFPLFYITDLLQTVEALVALGYANDPRLANALTLIQEKQDAEGRWAMEYSYAEKTWENYGAMGQPNPWVTLRALRALKPLQTY